MIRHTRLGLVAALATLAVLGGSGTAAAVWTASASSTTTATSATVKTSIAQTGLASTTPQQWTAGSAAALTGTLTLRNEGTAPLTYTLALAVTGDATLAAKTTLTMWTAATCSATVGADAVTTTLANTAPALPASAREIPAGETRIVCATTRITGTDGTTTNAALQGRSLTATFTATGRIGSWTASGSAASFTQSVYRLEATGPVSCNTNVQLFTSTVTLSWAAPSNRSGAVSYTIRDASNQPVATIAPTNASVVTTELEPGIFARNGQYSLTVVAAESAFGTTSSPSAAFTITRHNPILVTRLSCGAS